MARCRQLMCKRRRRSRKAKLIHGQSKALITADQTSARVGRRLPVSALSHSWINWAIPKITRMTRLCCHMGNMRRRCCRDSTKKVMRVRTSAFCPSNVPYSTSSARPSTNAVVMPTLFGTARVQNDTSKASHMGRNTSMNCGMGETLSSRPMANVSQMTQPLLRRDAAIIASGVERVRPAWQVQQTGLLAARPEWPVLPVLPVRPTRQACQRRVRPDHG
ncbi:hypothetical protein METHP14_460008 [Pseudomonas sp. P14-2025]